jgi:hypothetical protein
MVVSNNFKYAIIVMFDMSEEKWYEKEFFTEDRKEKGKKAGKASAFGGLGLILFSFFLGYLFLHNTGPEGTTTFSTQLETGIAFAVFVFLGFAAGFCGLFIGVYYIFHLGEWFIKAQGLAGLTGSHPLMWWGFYPAAFIGCLINFAIIVAIVFFILRWIVRKLHK